MSERPKHVPPERLFDFDFYSAPRGCPHPQVEVARRLHEQAPDIFYTTSNGGHWVVTRYKEAMDICRRPDLFSNDPRHNATRRIYPRSPPNQYDPPEQTEYRRIISTSFTPSAVQELTGEIRALARRLVGEAHPRGGCEFVADFARRFPVNIFLRLADAPVEDMDYLLGLVEKYVRGTSVDQRAAARGELGSYLETLLQKRSRAPGDDLLTKIVQGRINGRPLESEEQLGMATLAFFAGLDTVAAMLSFIIYFLGRNPDLYQPLVERPDKIPDYLEELIRVHGVALNERGATHDFEFAGVRFREGDRVLLLNPAFNVDDRAVPNADIVDYERIVSTHVAFGAGPHRCLGSHLARAELRIFLGEWVSRIPAFTVDEVEIAGGFVWMPSRLSLSWSD
jgi:cytochrome P450